MINHSSNNGVMAGVGRGPERVAALRLHRLAAFEEAFSDYLAGRATAARVKQRWDKLKAVGLPKIG